MKHPTFKDKEHVHYMLFFLFILPFLATLSASQFIQPKNVDEEKGDMPTPPYTYTSNNQFDQPQADFMNDDVPFSLDDQPKDPYKEYPFSILTNPAVFITGCSTYEKKKKKQNNHANQEEAPLYTLKNLKGVKEDLYQLATFFSEHYGYKVWCTYKYDLHNSNPKPSGAVMKRHYKSVLKKIQEASKNHDGLIFAFSGHGSKNYIYFQDGAIPIRDIRNALASSFQPHQPKIFLFFSCRTNDLSQEDMKKLEKGNEENEESVQPIQNINLLANCYTIHSTVDGFKSYLDSKKGSFVINDFITTLKQEHNKPLQNCMEILGRIVKQQSNENKELVDISHTLDKTLFLHEHTQKIDIQQYKNKHDKQILEIKASGNLTDKIKVWETEARNENSLHSYISPKAKWNEQDENSFDVDKAVHDFLKPESTKSSLVIKGNSGGGKTTYMRYLYHQLWKARKPKDPIPLLLELGQCIPAINDNKLIEKGLNDVHGIWTKEAYELQKQYKCILLLDGYDETGLKEALYTTQKLDQWADKVIFTVRKEYQVDPSYFVPYKNNMPQKKLYQEMTLQPFDQGQIDHYLQKIAQLPNAEWKDWQKYRTTIDSIPDLKNMISNPFLLQMICDILPGIVANHTEKKQSIDTIKLLRANIYDEFTQQWFERNNYRLQQRKIDAINIKLYQQFAEKLASQMLQRGEVVIKYTPPVENLFEDEAHNLQQPDVWHKFFDPNNKKIVHIREGMPLRKIGDNSWTFIHKTLLEYFGARHIFNQASLPIQHNNNIHYNQDINEKLLNDQPEIIRFLVDMVQQQDTFKEQLFAYIEASKKDPNIAIAAANSATILAMADIKLHDRNWQGIRIPGASLDQAFLARTNFSGSDCRNVSLRQTYLENTIWNNAQVQGIDFGEYPYLQHTAVVNSVSWSPDGKKLASASGSWDGKDCTVRIWDGTTGKVIKACTGHTRSVVSVRWSPDGKKLASASWDKTVRIWDGTTGNFIKACMGHTAVVNSVSWSPDGKKLASASGSLDGKDCTVRIWDGTTGKVIKACTGHTSWVNSVSWSPDGKKLASVSWDKTVRIWDGTTGNVIKACTGHTADVNSVSWSPDGKKLASASYDKTVRIWDGTTGKVIKACTGHTADVNSVSWSPDGKKLASASYDHTVRIWDGTTGNVIKACMGHTSSVISVSWSPDGKKLASASSDHTVRIWDGTTGNVIKACGHTDYVKSVSWSPDGKKLASASSDHTVRIWDGTTGKVIKACTGHTDTVWSVSWSPDGKKLASASSDDTVRIWDGTTGNVIKACTGHTDKVECVRWSPDGKKLASASSDHTVRIWDGTTGKVIKACTGHTDKVECVRWSPDGKKLASASYDDTVRIWDGTTGKVIKAYTGHTSVVECVRWSPDGKKLASTSYDTVRIWDGTTGKVIKACTGHTFWVNSVSWSPDGKKLASASGSWYGEDCTVRIWDGTTGKVIKACTGHTDTVWSVSWSPDGKKLASASSDHTVRIWDGTTGKVIKAYTGHTADVKSVSWSPDGKKLASASSDDTVRIWDGTTGKVIKACMGHTSSVISVSWSPDGKKLASASYDNTVRIWNEQQTYDLFVVLGDHGALSLKGANFQRAIGLSDTHQKLIKQRDGICGDKNVAHDDEKKEEAYPKK